MTTRPGQFVPELAEIVDTTIRVERVLYVNDAKSWTVARATWADGAPPDAPVSGGFGMVGPIPAAAPGDVFHVRGSWQMSQRYGLQLAVTSAVLGVGGSETDIAAFLTRMPQVGRARAWEALRALGGKDAVIEALEHDPQRLTAVRGITAERAAAIGEEYQQQRGIVDSLKFLHTLGLEDRLVGRILEQWEGKSRKLVEHDPYVLLDIYGLAFKQVDGIARTFFKMDRDDPRRLRAAAAIAIGMVEDEGHTWAPMAELTGTVQTYLGTQLRKRIELTAGELEHGLELASLPAVDAYGEMQPPLVVIRAALPVEPDLLGATEPNDVAMGEVDEAVNGDDEAINPDDGTHTDADAHLRGHAGARVWSAALDYAESGIAEHLMRLIRAEVEEPDDLEVAADVWGTNAPADEQVQALDALRFGHRVMVVTGGPGVGKTYTVKALLTTLEQAGLSVALCAPTGKAARRMTQQTGHAATTIHRLLAFAPGIGFRHDDGVPEYRETGVWFRGGPVDYGAVVVDETSMVDTQVFHALVRAIPSGARLIIVGDVDQLPSIGAGACLRDVIDSGIVPVCRLSRIFRQASDSAIPYIARDIRDGRAPDLSAGAGVMFIGEDDPEVLRECIVRAVAQVLPTSNPRNGRRAFDPTTEIQVLAPQRSTPIGIERLNADLQARLNPQRPGDSTLWIGGGYQARVGDRVQHVKNNYKLSVFNGESGLVLAADFRGLYEADLVDLGLKPSESEVPEGEFSPSSAVNWTTDASGRTDRRVVVEFDDRRVAYGKEDVRELVLGYAITLHKSQGDQFPCVVMPIHEVNAFMLTRSLLYTGVTRAAELVVLYGSRAQIEKAVQNTRGAGRRTSLLARLQHLMTAEATAQTGQAADVDSLTGLTAHVEVSSDDGRYDATDPATDDVDPADADPEPARNRA